MSLKQVMSLRKENKELKERVEKAESVNVAETIKQLEETPFMSESFIVGMLTERLIQLKEEFFPNESLATKIERLVSAKNRYKKLYLKIRGHDFLMDTLKKCSKLLFHAHLYMKGSENVRARGCASEIKKMLEHPVIDALLDEFDEEEE